MWEQHVCRKQPEGAPERASDSAPMSCSSSTTGEKVRALRNAARTAVAATVSACPLNSWQLYGTTCRPRAAAAARTAVLLPLPLGPCRSRDTRRPACKPLCSTAQPCTSATCRCVAIATFSLAETLWHPTKCSTLPDTPGDRVEPRAVLSGATLAAASPPQPGEHARARLHQRKCQAACSHPIEAKRTWEHRPARCWLRHCCCCLP